MKTEIACVLLAAGIFLECRATVPLKYNVHHSERTLQTAPPNEAFKAGKQYTVDKDSSLCRDPVVPKGVSKEDTDKYIAGFRFGWRNTVRWEIICIIPGESELCIQHNYGFERSTSLNEVFSRGESDGASQAEKDFNTFCLELEKRLKK